MILVPSFYPWVCLQGDSFEVCVIAYQMKQCVLASIVWQSNNYIYSCEVVPGRRALTEIQHDVKEAREAIEEVVDSDQARAAVCLRDGDEEAPEEPDLAPGRHHRRRHHPQQASLQL